MQSWFRQPSWWIVMVAGVLFVTFGIAIIREVINSHNVRQQVARLEHQVADEENRQRQLQDLIDYLGSPTFQEQEARLKLGLKKEGEQVIVVPPSNSPVSNSTVTPDGTTTVTSTTQSRPAQWWNYFFGRKNS